MLETDLEARNSVAPFRPVGTPPVREQERSSEALPPNWYLATEAFRVRRKPVPLKVAGVDLVVFRKSDGTLAALQSACSHLGASLAQGRVENDCLVCPFHGWAYRDSGECASVPGQRRIPEFARLERYPVTERGGLVWVFLGAGNPTPVPEQVGGQRASQLFRLDVGAPWEMIAANGFDANHFENVHGRRPLERSRVTYPDVSSIEVVHSYELTQRSGLERVLSRLLGTRLQLRYRVVGGTRVLAETAWGWLRNRMIFSLLPTGAESCTVVGAVVSETRGPWGWLTRALQRRATLAFFREEVGMIQGARLNLEHLVESDRILRIFYTWLLERRGHV